jgi:hypothetical protein
MYRIKPEELFENYLRKYETPWLVISRNIKSSVAQKTQFQYVPGEEDGIYYFNIVLPLSDEIHKYNVYERDDFEPYNILQSALYVQRAAECLSLYREPIGQYDLDYLGSVLKNIGKPARMRDMTMDLFYKNLLSKNLHIVKYGEKFEENKRETRLQIKPIYGPSHNPLLIRTSNNEILTILFTNNLVKKEGEGTDVYRINIERDSVISYYIIDLVKLLSRENARTKEEVIKIVTNYQGYKFPLHHYDRRLDVLNRTVLLSIKLAQLYSPRSLLEGEDEWQQKIILSALGTIRSIQDKFKTSDPEEMSKNVDRILKHMITDFLSVK